MKTFEERYTAWIDGQLEGPAVTSFELELSRRAASGEARADKADAGRLRQLLSSHLQAPAMTNTEFFSHQLRERIAADRASERRRETPRTERKSLFAWSFGQLAGLGAAFVFVAVALYYGLVPQKPISTSSVAKATVQPSTSVLADKHDTAPDSQSVAPAPVTQGSPGEIQLAKASPTPPPIDLAPEDIQKVQVSDPSTPTTATPLHYQKSNVNVLWINGLDYMPTVPGDAPAGSATAATPQP